ncbi:MAG: ATP synthase F1 subunit epsilon [Planctomycetes bacterium]|nr:ATP synthase F1 subunit epsilon [Planctomycetota bacterium]
MRVQIVTPDASFFDGDADSAVLPGWDGELGVLPGHAPLIARLGHGVARVQATGGQQVRIAVYGGFVKVQDDLVTVLAGGAAKPPEAPDEAAARAALEAARRRLDEVRAQGKTAAAQLPEAEEGVRRAQTFLRLVARKGA